MGITTVKQRGPIKGSCLLGCPVIRGYLKVVLCKVRLVPQNRLRLVPQGVDTLLLQHCLEAGLASGVPKHPKRISCILVEKEYFECEFHCNLTLNNNMTFLVSQIKCNVKE